MITFSLFVDPVSSLRVRIRNNRKKSEIVLGVKLAPDVFEDAMSDKPRRENLRWSSLLKHYLSELEDIRIELIKAGRGDEDVKSIAVLARRRLLGDDVGSSSKGLFMPFFEACMRRQGNAGYKASIKYTIDKIYEYERSRASELTFDAINLKWLRDFDEWLAGEGLSRNSRCIHFKNIRTAINRAIDEELTNNYPFRRFKIRQEATRKRSLSVDELRKLFSYEVEPYQGMYRDMFKLMFMLCGINAVDLYNLKSITSDGRIEYRRAKTHKLYSIKVEPEAMEIIERYRGKKGLLCITDRWKSHKDFIKNCNIALKAIGGLERIGLGSKKIRTPEWPNLTTYWCRHSWSTAAYQLDVPYDTIAQALGHKNSGPSVTATYIDFDERKVDEANRRVLDWVLYGER